MRGRAATLLVMWAASLLAPIFHVDDLAGDDSASVAVSARSEHHHCSGHFDRSEVGVHFAPSCDPNAPCRDPLHHHHPVGHHDATQCPICSSLLERAAEISVFSFAPPRAVRFVASRVVTLPSSAERFACALARGPPQRAA